MQTRFRMMVFGALGCALALGSEAAAQAVVAGGKVTQAIYDCTQSFDDVDDRLVVSLTVPKGVKKRMLVVNANARGVGGGTCDMALNLDFATEDGFGGSTSGAMGSVDTATGSWWADLDALEAAAPGTFLGVPFPVTLNVFRSASSTCQKACVALSVQVVKK